MPAPTVTNRHRMVKDASILKMNLLFFIGQFLLYISGVQKMWSDIAYYIPIP